MWQKRKKQHGAVQRKRARQLTKLNTSGVDRASVTNENLHNTYVHAQTKETTWEWEIMHTRPKFLVIIFTGQINSQNYVQLKSNNYNATKNVLFTSPKILLI